VEVLSVHVERGAKQDGNLWSPVVYAPGATRGLAGVESVEAFVLDLDDAPLDAVRPKLAGLEWFAYSTWSFSGSAGVHVVVPLVEPVDAWEWESAWDACFAFVGGVGDSACRDASRIYYRPQHAKDAPHFTEHARGDRLDVSSLATSRPRAVTRAGKRPARRGKQKEGRVPDYLSEEWWNEPQDLSRFAGKSEKEVAGMLLEELRRIRAELEAEEAGV